MKEYGYDTSVHKLPEKIYTDNKFLIDIVANETKKFVMGNGLELRVRDSFNLDQHVAYIQIIQAETNTIISESYTHIK